MPERTPPTDLPILPAPDETVWIPAVPLPLLGWRTDRCFCGAKFRGKGRKRAYEIHYRRAHQRDDMDPDQTVLMSMPREQARLLYLEVNADAPPSSPEQAA